MDYPYELEKGSRKHRCPSCGRITFVRVVEVSTGRHLPGHVGRCDRESKCGYQYTWKQYLVELQAAGDRLVGSVQMRRQEAGRGAAVSGQPQFVSPTQGPARIDHSDLLECLGDYELNTFARFLIGLFPNDCEWVIRRLAEYCVGTRDGFTVFPTIDRFGRVCKAKLIRFDALGHTLKHPDGKRAISSLEHFLKREGRIAKDFQTDKNVFFGEHLLRKYPTLPIGIVESEKTAVITSICAGAFPMDLVWLATGSKQWLNARRILRLGRDRRIVLYPDVDGFEKWHGVATKASQIGIDVRVSRLIERSATDWEMRAQFDLADYLIREQQKRNDPDVRETFRYAMEERLAIMTADGGVSESEAEAEILDSGFYEQAIREACRV